MNGEELPAWLALPEEVRRRVVERSKGLWPEGPPSAGESEKHRQDLRDLTVSQLVAAHQGDIAKAIAFVSRSPEARELLNAIGERESDWVAAIARCQETLNRIVSDEHELHRGLVVQQLVIEELEAYRSRN